MFILYYKSIPKKSAYRISNFKRFSKSLPPSPQTHGRKFKISKILNFWKSSLKHAVCLQLSSIPSLNGHLSIDKLKLNQRSCANLPNSGFWGWLSVESQPKNPEFRNNPANLPNSGFWGWLPNSGFWGWLSVESQPKNPEFRNNPANLPNSGCWGWLSVESQPKNLEFRNNPESFHPCKHTL